MHPCRTKSSRGFTMVEMLVVIGIMAALVALLMPALSGVRKRARKTSEINNIRQVGLAWNAYSTSNEDFASPGFLTVATQQAWKVKYEYPNHVEIPPAPDYNTANVAGPWTWRLMPYFGYNLEIIRDYLGDDEEIRLDNLHSAAEEEWMLEATLAVANTPAFGYNGYFVGGYYELYDLNGEKVRPAPRFFDVEDDNGVPLNPVASSAATMRKPAEMIVFCSSTLRDRPGVYGRNNADTQFGYHLVEAPFMGDEHRWGRAGVGGSGPDGGGGTANTGDIHSLETLGTDVAVPLGRHNGLPAIYFGDGHVESQTMTALYDQTMWLNMTRKVGNTHERYFRHSDTKRPVAE